MVLQLTHHDMLRYWASTPNQHRQTNRLYRRMRIGAVQRELSRNNGERFLAHGCGCVPREEWLSLYSTTVLPNRAHLWYKGGDGLRWPGKISASMTTKGVMWCAFWKTRCRSSFLFFRRATRI